jgi:hypothetical protein
MLQVCDPAETVTVPSAAVVPPPVSTVTGMVSVVVPFDWGDWVTDPIAVVV